MILLFWSLDCWFSEGSDGGEAPVLAARFFENWGDKGVFDETVHFQSANSIHG
jgi:hypothetical protein